MSRKIGNAQSRATFFRHSAVLSLPAVLLRKLANSELTQQDGWKTQLGRQNDEKMSRKIENAQSRATFFRHSAVLSLPAVLLRKLASLRYATATTISNYLKSFSSRLFHFVHVV